MTTAEDLFWQLSDKKYLSKIHLTKVYWQIPVEPEDNMSFWICHLECWIQELLLSEDWRKFKRDCPEGISYIDVWQAEKS